MLPKTKAAVITESDVVMYLATALKHLRLMALLICMSLLLGVDYYVYSRSVYFSNSMIRFRSFARTVDSEAIWNDANDRFLTSALQSPEIIFRTAKRLGLDPSPKMLYRKHLKAPPRIRRNSEKDFTVEIWTYAPHIARDWTKTLIEEYIAHREQRRLEYAEKAVRSFTVDMEQMKERMQQSSNQKFDFKQKNEMDKLFIELTELKLIPHQLAIIKHRLSVMDGIKSSLADPARDTVARLALLDSLEADPSTRVTERLQDNSLQLTVGQVIPDNSVPNGGTSEVVVLPSMVQNPTIKPWVVLDKELHRLQKNLITKGRNLLPGHPQMAALNKQLNTINEALDLEYEVAHDSFNLEYANLRDKQKQFEAKLPGYHDVSHRHEELLKEYKRFDSGQLAWGTLYGQMSKRLETIDFGFDKDRAEFEFGGHLSYSENPVAPSKGRAILNALLMGCLLAIAVPFLLEYLNGRVSDVEHAEETLRIRALGVVPKIIGTSFDALLLEVSSAKSDNHLKESFRLIRTNLAMNADNGALPQVILITSSMPQEGKTSVATNLALSFANKGEKTLLIDGDLRRGRVHKLFEIQNRPGLSDFLSGHGGKAEDCCRQVGHENLTVLTCGKHLNSASELLDSEGFTKLMIELRGKYQRIILDSPPVLGLSETLIMQRCADGVIMVIWSDFTSMSSVKSAMQALQVNGAKFSGFVLNRLDFSALANRYKYFYYAPLYYANYQPIPITAPANTIKI